MFFRKCVCGEFGIRWPCCSLLPLPAGSLRPLPWWMGTGQHAVHGKTTSVTALVQFAMPSTSATISQHSFSPQVSGFLMGLSVIGSIFNITGIAVNRYCYICHSFSYSRLYSYRNTLLFVALIWLLTVVAIVPNFFVGSLRYDPRVYSCTFAQNVSSSYTVAVVVVHFLVPIAVVTFCYLRIWVLVIQVRLLASLCGCIYRHIGADVRRSFRITT